MAATGKNFMRKLSLEHKKIEKSSQKFTRTVVTSFSPLGYYSYGKRFIEQFARFWPKKVKLIIYLEAPLPIKTTEQIEPRMFSKICPEIIEFKARHMNNAKANGFVDGKTKNYRYDAIKFCHKVYALTHCALSNPSEKLYWIDASQPGCVFLYTEYTDSNDNTWNLETPEADCSSTSNGNPFEVKAVEASYSSVSYFTLNSSLAILRLIPFPEPR